MGRPRRGWLIHVSQFNVKSFERGDVIIGRPITAEPGEESGPTEDVGERSTYEKIHDYINNIISFLSGTNPAYEHKW